MDQPAPLPHAKSPLLLIVATVTLLVGAGVGYAFGTKMSTNSSYTKGYEQARTDIRARIPQLGSTIGAESITALSGTITAISGNIITMESSTQNPDPTGTPFPTTRKVTVTAGTILNERVMKSREAFVAERIRYQEQAVIVRDVDRADEAVETVEPPTEFTTGEIALKDVKTGMEISVSAEQDISTAVSIEAAVITVTQPRADESADDLAPAKRAPTAEEETQAEAELEATGTPAP